MYLAKLAMDPRHPSIRQALKDRQDMHRNLAHAFQGKFLYRLTENGNQPELLTLSKELPQEEQLGQNGYRVQGVQDVSALREKLKDGAVLRFNLLTSPSKKVETQGRRNSRRDYLSTPALRQEWLQRQGSKYGFDVLEAHEPSAEETICIGRRTGAFKLTAVEFEGVLRIRDSERFWASWENGIGPEKAYGLGLMLLSR